MKRPLCLVTVSLIVSALITLALAACGSKAPPCADPKTVGLVQQICRENIESQAASRSIDKSVVNQALNAVHLSVTMIRPDTYDKSVDKYTCRASLDAKLPAEAAQLIQASGRASSLSPVEFDGTSLKMEVKYTSQLADGSKQHIVELQGHRPLMEAVLALGAYGMLTPKAASVKQPESQAANQMQVQPPPSQQVQTDKSEDGICKDLDTSVTADLLTCLGRKYTIAERALNETYRQLMSRLDPSRRAALKKEEIAWIKEKDRKCQLAGKEFRGGTLETVKINDCFLQMTQQRLEYLKNYK